jgi:hypothetical protein
VEAHTAARGRFRSITSPKSHSETHINHSIGVRLRTNRTDIEGRSWQRPIRLLTTHRLVCGVLKRRKARDGPERVRHMLKRTRFPVAIHLEQRGWRTREPKTPAGYERLFNKVARECGLGPPTRAEQRAIQAKTRNREAKLSPGQIDKKAYHCRNCPLRSDSVPAKQSHRTIVVSQHHELLQQRSRDQQTEAFQRAHAPTKRYPRHHQRTGACSRLTQKPLSRH